MFSFGFSFSPSLLKRKKKKKSEENLDPDQLPRTKRSVAVAGGGQRSGSWCGALLPPRKSAHLSAGSGSWRGAGSPRSHTSAFRARNSAAALPARAVPAAPPPASLPPSHTRRPITARAAPGAAVDAPGSCRWEEGGWRATPAAAPALAAKWRRNRCWEGSWGSPLLCLPHERDSLPHPPWRTRDHRGLESVCVIGN